MAVSPTITDISEKSKEALTWTSPLPVSMEKSEQQQMVESLFAQIISSPERRVFLAQGVENGEALLPPPMIQSSFQEGHFDFEVQINPHPVPNFNERDHLGRTALHRAAEDGQPEAIRALIDADVDLNIQDWYGRTALHMALFGGSPEAIRALIGAGINPNIQDYDGKIALDYALLYHNMEAICAFIEADPQTNIPEDLKKTLFWSALRRCDLSSAWQLLPVSKFQIAMVAIGGSLLLLNALSQLYLSTEENLDGEL